VMKGIEPSGHEISSYCSYALQLILMRPLRRSGATPFKAMPGGCQTGG
jgi:hypothetical protein